MQGTNTRQFVVTVCPRSLELVALEILSLSELTNRVMSNVMQGLRLTHQNNNQQLENSTKNEISLPWSVTFIQRLGLQS